MTSVEHKKLQTQADSPETAQVHSSRSITRQGPGLSLSHHSWRRESRPPGVGPSGGGETGPSRWLPPLPTASASPGVQAVPLPLHAQQPGLNLHWEELITNDFQTEIDRKRFISFPRGQAGLRGRAGSHYWRPLLAAPSLTSTPFPLPAPLFRYPLVPPVHAFPFHGAGPAAWWLQPGGCSITGPERE